MLVPSPFVSLAANLGRFAARRVARADVGGRRPSNSRLVNGGGRQNFADAQIDVFEHNRIPSEGLRRFSTLAASVGLIATDGVTRTQVGGALWANAAFCSLDGEGARNGEHFPDGQFDVIKHSRGVLSVSERDSVRCNATQRHQSTSQSRKAMARRFAQLFHSFAHLSNAESERPL